MLNMSYVNVDRWLAVFFRCFGFECFCYHVCCEGFSCAIACHIYIQGTIMEAKGCTMKCLACHCRNFRSLSGLHSPTLGRTGWLRQCIRPHWEGQVGSGNAGLCRRSRAAVHWCGGLHCVKSHEGADGAQHEVDGLSFQRPNGWNLPGRDQNSFVCCLRRPEFASSVARPVGFDCHKGETGQWGQGDDKACNRLCRWAAAGCWCCLYDCIGRWKWKSLSSVRCLGLFILCWYFAFF